MLQDAPGHRFVYSPTGPINRDYDDVRSFSTAARAGIRRLIDAGSVKPLVYFPNEKLETPFLKYVQVSLLGILQELYEPLQTREFKTVEEYVVGFHIDGYGDVQHIENDVNAMEAGRFLARDLGDSDPERMTPRRFAEHVVKSFEGRGNVKVSVKTDIEELKREYPLLMSVSRASMLVERHWPCVVRLEFQGEGDVEESLFFAGKGVTYDTGGADIKAGGIMAGMSRDKCGASNIAGFVMTASILNPTGLKIVAELGMVRNSVGSNGYVSDEVLVSHAGVRVKVNNTDAEGRMVLIDLLSHLRVEAVNAVNPRLISMATLTGHAVRSYGFYTATLDNGPAKKQKLSKKLQNEGEKWGDPFEISIVRKDDFDSIQPKNSTYDVTQSSYNATVSTPRGHQIPTAIMIVASGLSQHGLDSEHPLCYSHLDIAGSACEGSDFKLGKVTASCLVALTARYVFPHISQAF